MNTKDCTEIAANSKYIEEVFGIRYKLITNDIIRPKNEAKA